MHNRNSYALSVLIILSALVFSMIGNRWHTIYYSNESGFSPSNPPLATAMRGLHDGIYMSELFGSQAVTNISLINNDAQLFADVASHLSKTKSSAVSTMLNDMDSYHFTTATDDYFNDACFIGDSRTVGISQYAGIENATFLCKNSLSIYDYDKKKILYNDTKTSIREVLTQQRFTKIYLMVGINECGIGTPETFFNKYKEVVADIRNLQPDSLIFIQGNLLVTKNKSDDSDSITNDNISARNMLISTLANQNDIFYIDINESSLCDNGALISDYTWDQVHIRAQYYPIWKNFLLTHAIVI